MSETTRRDLLKCATAALALPALAAPAGAVERAPLPPAAGSGVRTGGARRIKLREGHEVWVKSVGAGPLPVLTLHGGPGWPHYYLECMEDFLPQAGINFWYYDQLGCGFSDAPDNDALWTVERYREEVEQVRAALGFERFILYGHSWGGMLAMEYALKYPEHLAGLVISNMTASCAEYLRHAEQLIAALPAAAQAVIAKYRKLGQFDAPEYQQVLMDEVYAKHVCRLKPWPEPVLRATRFMNARIYNVMQGPDEFNVVGNFKDWDIWDRLPAIRTPTLLLAGRHDEMDASQIERMQRLIPNSRLAMCEQGSHMALYDDQQAYFRALVAFLKEIQGRAHPA